MKTKALDYFNPWIIGVTLFVIITNVTYVAFTTPDFIRSIYRILSFGKELTIGVWWSSICLVISSMLFYKVFLSIEAWSKKYPWAILSICSICLAIDELGTLHELVKKNYGWIGLLPFAICFVLGYVIAIFQLLKLPNSKQTAYLVLGAISFFLLVVCLEYFEYHPYFDIYPQKIIRYLSEEVSELIGMNLLIIAGFVGLSKQRFNSIYLSEIFTDVLVEQQTRIIIAFGLSINILLIYTVGFEFGSKFRGNPFLVFPCFTFFILGISCFYHSSPIDTKNFQRLVGVVLILSSISQPMSLDHLIYALTKVKMEFLGNSIIGWMSTLLPLMFCYSLGKTKTIKTKMVFMILLPVVVICFFSYANNDINFDYFNDDNKTVHFAYFTYSSFVAYFCFELIRRKRITISHTNLKY